MTAAAQSGWWWCKLPLLPFHPLEALRFIGFDSESVAEQADQPERMQLSSSAIAWCRRARRVMLIVTLLDLGNMRDHRQNDKGLVLRPSDPVFELNDLQRGEKQFREIFKF